MKHIKKTICIIDHYSSEPKYGGISRHYDFGNEFSKNGYNVIIISSSFSHYTHSYFSNDKILINEINPNFHYVYIKTLKYDSNSGFRRILSTFSYLIKVLLNENNIFKQFGKPDVVIGCSIHQLAWVAAKIISNRYKCKFCAEVRDLWPRVWIKAGEKSKLNSMVIVLFALEKYIFKKADKIIYSMEHGDGYICDELNISRNKVCWIGQPMDCSRFNINKNKFNKIPEEIRTFIKNSFVCVFTGYYMTYEGVYVMLRAAKILKEKHLPIKMVFVGSGKEKEGMLQFTNDNNLNNVLIFDRIKKEVVPALISNCSICLAHLGIQNHKDVFKYGASKNKLVEYMYSGACTVYGFSHKNEISESHCGFCYEPYDEIALATLIENIYRMSASERTKIGNYGIEYIEKEHDVKYLSKKLESVLFS